MVSTYDLLSVHKVIYLKLCLSVCSDTTIIQDNKKTQYADVAMRENTNRKYLFKSAQSIHNVFLPSGSTALVIGSPLPSEDDSSNTGQAPPPFPCSLQIPLTVTLPVAIQL